MSDKKVGNKIRNKNAYNAIAKDKFPTYRIEYRGMLKADIISKSALDFSDNGRCWWIQRKLQEYVYLPHRPRVE